MSSSAPPSPPDGVRIISAWTKAGIASCVHVTGGMGPQEEILFDIGACNTSTLIAKSVFISHGHVDHIGAAIIHARMKSLQNQSSTYYIPEECYAPLLEAKAAFEKLDHSEIKMNLKIVKPGDIVEVSKNLKCKVFETKHRVSSQGYALYRKLPGALLPQFQSLPPQEIAMLKNSGVQIKARESEKLEFVYTGDTSFDGLLLPENDFVFESPILFLECTYLDGEIKKAHEWGHIHLQEIITRASLFHNRMIILCHFSSRYSHAMVLNLLRQKLPLELACRVFVNLKGFGSEDELTRLIEVPFDVLESEPGYGWANSVTGYTRRSGSSGGMKNAPLPPPPLPQNNNNRGSSSSGSDNAYHGDSYAFAAAAVGVNIPNSNNTFNGGAISSGNGYYASGNGGGGDYNKRGDFSQSRDSTGNRESSDGYDKGRKRPASAGRDSSGSNSRVPNLNPPVSNNSAQQGRAAGVTAAGTGYVNNSSSGGYTDTVNFDAWGNPITAIAAATTGYSPVNTTAAQYLTSGTATSSAVPYDASKYPYIAAAIGSVSSKQQQQQTQPQPQQQQQQQVQQQQQMYSNRSSVGATASVYGLQPTQQQQQQQQQYGQSQAFPVSTASGYQTQPVTAQQQLQYAYATAQPQQQSQYSVQQQQQYPVQQVVAQQYPTQQQQSTTQQQQQQYQQYPLAYDKSQQLQQQSLNYFSTGTSTYTAATGGGQGRKGKVGKK